MNIKMFDHSILYDNASDFFKLKGNASMKLSPEGAKEVCQEATKQGVFVGIVEGGHWRNPGFQPDMTRRWDSKTRLERDGNYKRNNELAIENINDVADGYTAFLVTLIRFNKDSE